MVHIFEFDDTTKLYTSNSFSEAAHEALLNGRLYYKIDGSNGMLVRDRSGDEEESATFLAYQRLDTRGKPIPENCVALPAGENAESYEGHSYCYEPILANVDGKKARKRNQAMLATVEHFSEHLSGLHSDFVSIEWVGKKFNKTPGVPADIAIAIHSEQTCDENVERTYDGMRSFLLEADPPIEGLVLEHEGIFWKIRADCFDRKCKFKTHTATARPPVFLATDPTPEK